VTGGALGAGLRVGSETSTSGVGGVISGGGCAGSPGRTG
jgi:hypothetical protein